MNCQHSECDCGNASVERNGQQYCSESCASGASLGESYCGCGHAGCSASPDTKRMSASPIGAGASSQGSRGYGTIDRSSGPSVGNPRASASSSGSGPQAPRRPESGSASPRPLSPSPDDRGRRKDIGTESGRSDSSRRPDVPSGSREQSGGPRLASDEPTKPPRR